ncbi:beta-1,3-glucosyltransferase isoform X2 [Pseudomyrmex gracilis]|nr:beta-1,3-glucosyltransferase isoform X2 [Pseudomyrmex gracilis]
MITPFLKYIKQVTASEIKWFFFCLENTMVQLEKLLNVLGNYNSSQNLWIGQTLFDQEPSIIHHFAIKKTFKYPLLASGFAMTSVLMQRLIKHIESYKLKNEFSIDMAWEFAKFVLDSSNTKLTHESKLCIVSTLNCATYVRYLEACNFTILPEHTYFAVKTCAKYHTNRIPVIKNTWAKNLINIGYFSDVADRNLPEAYVVPNTTTGHCLKTYSILQKADHILKTNRFKWLVISDDDTILSPVRLLRLLTCYNSDRPVAIGERYGFRIWDLDNGFEYLTSGGGVALSASLVHRIVKVCSCPEATTPDDMYLFGNCLKILGIKPVHSPLFHQARPLDYAYPYLASQEPISFHGFWNIDPVDIYDEWFADTDSILSHKERTQLHTEL